MILLESSRRGFLASLIASTMALFFGRLQSFLKIFWKWKALPPYTDPFYPEIRGTVSPIFDTVSAPGMVRSFDDSRDPRAKIWKPQVEGQTLEGRYLQFMVKFETRRVGLPKVNLRSRRIYGSLPKALVTCLEWEDDEGYG